MSPPPWELVVKTRSEISPLVVDLWELVVAILVKCRPYEIRIKTKSRHHVLKSAGIVAQLA